jgi:hypothetical protein
LVLCTADAALELSPMIVLQEDTVAV